MILKMEHILYLSQIVNLLATPNFLFVGTVPQFVALILWLLGQFQGLIKSVPKLPKPDR